MPELGDVITMLNHRKKIWAICPDCHKGRWVYLLHNKPISVRCRRCAVLITNKNKIGIPYHPEREGNYHKDGYVMLYRPMHPNSNKRHYIKRCILVMEESIGRFLKKGEHIHHINGIRDDDRLENLQILTNSEHARLHTKERHKKERVFK